MELRRFRWISVLAPLGIVVLIEGARYLPIGDAGRIAIDVFVAVLFAIFGITMMRIIQESLANVRKHSRATTASVDVRRRDFELIVTVSDNGIGFIPGSPTKSYFPRFGIPTMQERAATIGGALIIDSVPGRGTTVRLQVPIA